MIDNADDDGVTQRRESPKFLSQRLPSDIARRVHSDGQRTVRDDGLGA